MENIKEISEAENNLLLWDGERSLLCQGGNADERLNSLKLLLHDRGTSCFVQSGRDTQRFLAESTKYGMLVDFDDQWLNCDLLIVHELEGMLIETESDIRADLSYIAATITARNISRKPTILSIDSMESAFAHAGGHVAESLEMFIDQYNWQIVNFDQ